MPTPQGTRRSPSCQRRMLRGPTPNSWATRCCAMPSAPSVARNSVVATDGSLASAGMAIVRAARSVNAAKPELGPPSNRCYVSHRATLALPHRRQVNVIVLTVYSATNRSPRLVWCPAKPAVRHQAALVRSWWQWRPGPGR